jgi:phosphoribosylamine--glycine ligase
MKKVEDRVIKPTIEGLKKEGIPYKGFVFIGLMNVQGEPYVIEYNARMGDPETEAVMTRIDSDLVELLDACAKGQLKNYKITISPNYAVTIVMASGGYPENFEKGKIISGLNESDTAVTFHAGTINQGNKIVTNGGRVLAVTGTGQTLAEATKNAYAAVSKISWEAAYYRKDISLDLLKIENQA